MSNFLQLFLRSLETGSVYALAALGIVIIYRTSLITHFAQGSMGMFNTFLATYFFNKYSLPLPLAAILGLVSSLLVGFLVDFVVIRRAEKISPVAKQILTLGLIMIFLGLTPILFGVEPLTLPKFIKTGDVTIGNASISYNGILNISIGLIVMIAMFIILQKTKAGLAVRTTASNEPIARLMGVPTKTVTMIAWGIAGTLGTLAGIMIAPTTTVTVTLMNAVQVNALFACVLGGLQTFHGPIIGAYIIGIGTNLLRSVNSVWGEQIMYLLILIFLLIRPDGIIGKKFIKKV